MQRPKVEQLDKLTIEYVLATKMVVFSHGFGVRRDTSGFFTEIARNLPEGYGYVLFDYYEYDEPNNTVTVTNFTEQRAKLLKVLDWTAQQPGVNQIAIVAHSMGCVVTALAQPKNIQTVILLAPPTSIGEDSRNYFTSKPGAYEQNGIWFVPRRDGTISKLSVSVFDELESTAAAQVINDYANIHPLVAIFAGADEVITNADPSVFARNQSIQLLSVDNATHNFTGGARADLVKLIREHL